MKTHIYLIFILMLSLTRLGLAKSLYEDNEKKPYFNFSIRKSFVRKTTQDFDRYFGTQLSFHHPVPNIRPLDLGISFSYLLAKGKEHPNVSVEVDYFHITAPVTLSYQYLFRYHISLEPGVCLESSRTQVFNQKEKHLVSYFALKSSFGLDYAFTDHLELRTQGEVLYRAWHSLFDYSYLVGLQVRL